MIGFLTFIVTLIVLSVTFKLFSLDTYVKKVEKEYRGEKYTETQSNAMGYVKLVGVVIASMIIGFINPYEVERVDSGHVAILVENVGDNRGMSKVEYKRGWVMYNNFTQRYYEFPVFQQHIDYEENVVITKGGFQATIKPSFNYSLNPTTVDQMFQNLRVDIKQVEQGWLKNAIISSVNDVANLFTVDRGMSFHQAAKYVGAPLPQPAAPSGGDMALPNPHMIRPIVGGKKRRSKKATRKARKSRKQQKQKKQSGGFLPSIGEPFVAAVGKYIAPLALYGIYRFINGSKKTRKARKSRK
jgi:hypothetical protein